MRWPAPSKYSPIGLDLGSHSFKAVQLKRTTTGRQVAASVSFPRHAPGGPITIADIERLQAVLDRRGFVGHRAVVAVPAGNLLTAVLELPARAPGVPTERIAAIEFARVHKVDAGTLTLSTWDLPPSVRASKATYMLSVGAKAAELEAHLDLIESFGLDVVAVNEPFSAGARGCRHSVTAGEGLTAVVDLGWRAVTLAILKENTLVYTRKLAEAGLSRVYQAAMEAASLDGDDVGREIWRAGFGGSPAEPGNPDVLDVLGAHVVPMLKEIGQAFGYTGHQYSDATMTRVVLIGGGASIPGMAERFQDALGVPTRPAGDEESPSTGTPPSVMAVAHGLALWPEAAR